MSAYKAGRSKSFRVWNDEEFDDHTCVTKCPVLTDQQ